MSRKTKILLALAGLLVETPGGLAQPRLIQTIDLATWKGTPVAIVQPPLPVPSPGFSLTGIAYNPTNHTLYAADYATTNVYAIDTTTNTVSSAVYTNGLIAAADIGTTQALQGTAPKVVMVNPVTNRWIFLGQGGGAEFTGTALAEPINARSFQSGAAWDPVTDIVYGGDGIEFYAVSNLKFLFAGFPCPGSSNAAAVNPMTSRVYSSCGTSDSGGIVAYDGVAIGNSSVKSPTIPLGSALLGKQPYGVAVNPNTNRVFVTGMTAPNSLDVLDASTLQLIASIPALPDQSNVRLMDATNVLALPRPIAVNTLTNTIFVVNSLSSTVSVFDGNTNTLTGTIAIPVPAGAVVTQPVAGTAGPVELKPGNTVYDFSISSVTTLGGAISAVVNEASNTLYVASVNGTVSVFALDPAVTAPAFSANGMIRTPQGIPAAGVVVSAVGTNGNSAAVTDATGLFVLTGLTPGVYTVSAAAAGFSFAPSSQTLTVVDANVKGMNFEADPPIVPAGYTLSPWTLIGPGVTTTGTVTLNAPAPAGGAVVTLTSSDPKAAKTSSTLTVPAGQTAAAFPVQGSGVSAATAVTLTAQYNGGSAATNLTVAPGDKVSITSATFSQSTRTLTVAATGSNAQATLNVLLASNNQLLGTMVNQGGGTYRLQVPFPSGTPASVNVVSNLGAKTGQGVTVTP